MDRRQALITACAVTLAAVHAPRPARAQDYPSRPITIVVPFSPGGATDVVARTIAEKLAQRLGKPVVVENRPGGGGAIANDYVRQRPADGYTLYAVATPFSTAPITNPAVHKYDPTVDFTPIVRTSEMVTVIAVSAALPVNSVSELIAWARANPGALNVATTGIGSSDHLLPIRIEQVAGVKFNYVHYKGSTQGVQDLLSGTVQMKYDALSSVRAHIESGRLKALALATERPSPIMPNLPTLQQTLPGVFTRTYTGLLGPAGMKPEVVALLNREVNALLQQPDVRARLGNLGLEPVENSPQEFSAYLKAHMQFQQDTVKRAGIVLE